MARSLQPSLAMMRTSPAGVIMSLAVEQHIREKDDVWVKDWKYDPASKTFIYSSRRYVNVLLCKAVDGLFMVELHSKTTEEKYYRNLPRFFLHRWPNSWSKSKQSFSLADPELVSKVVQFLNEACVL